MVSGPAFRRSTVEPRSRIADSGPGNAPIAHLNCGFVEPMTGIEPAYSAWEADVLPLNYIGDVASEG
jgi:hypothetical protein